MKVLDIGCGDEKQKYPGAIGIDINPNYKPDINIDLMREDIPSSDNAYDMVISNDSIEHFENPLRAFREAYRVLKKSGIFRVETVNVSFLPIRMLPIDHNKLWRHKLGTERTGHLVHFTPDLMRMYYEIVGFTDIKIRGNALFSYHIYGEGRK